MSWLSRLFGIKPPAAPEQPTAWWPSPEWEPPSDAMIALALGANGYGQIEPHAIDFVRSVVSGDRFAKGLTLRRAGRLMSKDDLRAHGLRGNTTMSFECWDILTEKGRADPVRSTQSIMGIALGYSAGALSVARSAAVFGDSGMIQVTANNMAAGPCVACLELAAKPVPLFKAPMGPLPECPHPDQCRLHWRSISEYE